MVGGQLQALVVPCKLLHLKAQKETHPATVISSCALGQEKTCRFSPTLGDQGLITPSVALNPKPA